VRGVKATPNDALPRSTPELQLGSLLGGKSSADEALALLRSDDPFLFRAAVLFLAKDRAALSQHARDEDAKVRLGILLASRQAGLRDALGNALKDRDPGVRRAALQWIGEERLKDFVGRLDDAIAENPTPQVFDAWLAAAELLATEKIDPDGKVNTNARFEKIADLALDVRRDPALRALALHLLPTNQPQLTIQVLQTLLQNSNARLRLEAVRVLAARSDSPAQTELRKLASDANTPAELRLEALAGLALSANVPDTREILKAALASGDPMSRREAARSLNEPLTIAATAASTEPNAAAGRRLFFHPNGPLCSTCHEIEGRGRAIGPDLTSIWRNKPEQLVESIREPSKEIAPAFAQWHVKLRDGREMLGIDQFVDSKSDFTLRDATGALTKYKFADVVEREPSPVSMMPPGLTDRLTPQEFADLLAYLREPRD
jgi:putative heme-binding domain-containing protein